MRLTTLHLKNFRSAVGLTIPTDARRVLISGENFSGKTGVREAIRWAFLGRTAVTDGKGSGAEHLMPHGGTPAVEVVVEVAGLGGVSRVMQGGVRTLAVNGFTGDTTAQQSALYDRLGTSAAYLDAVLDTGHFLALHHADAKRLVLDLLDVRVEVDGVARTIDEVEGLYKQAFDARKFAKTKLRTFAVPPIPVGDQPHTVEAIQAQIQKIRTQLEGLTSTVGQTAGRRQTLQAALDKAQAFTPYRGEIPAEEVDRQIGMLQKQISIAEAEFDVAVGMPTVPKDAAASQDVRLIRSTMEALTAHKPTKGCVLESGVPCETHKSKFTRRVQALQETLEALGASPGTVGPMNVAQPTDSPLKAARSRLQALQVMKLKYDTDAVQARGQQETVDRLMSELQALPADAQGEADLVTLKARIAKGEQILADARKYWTALYLHQEGLKARDGFTAEVEALEARCELLGPNGVRAEALGQAIGTFATAVNRFTAPFGWTLAFAVDPWGVAVNGRPVETYSESQQFLIGIALQLAIAEVSGLSFAVVDRLDMLGVANRTKATQMLLSSSLEQVFILSTREADQRLPAIDGVIAHRLTLVDGRTRISESVGV